MLLFTCSCEKNNKSSIDSINGEWKLGTDSNMDFYPEVIEFKENGIFLFYLSGAYKKSYVEKQTFGYWDTVTVPFDRHPDYLYSTESVYSGKYTIVNGLVSGQWGNYVDQSFSLLIDGETLRENKGNKIYTRWK